MTEPEGRDEFTMPQKTWLRCPCGETIVGVDEDDLVAQALAHLDAEHPDLAGEYGREHILFMAQ